MDMAVHVQRPFKRASLQRRAVGQGLNDALFEVFMGHFRATLDELSVPPPQIAEIVKIAEGGRNDVLNR